MSMVRRIRDEQARNLKNKSQKEIVDFFTQAAERARQRVKNMQQDERSEKKSERSVHSAKRKKSTQSTDT
jgi:uncharacterized protein (UPF0305 family)